MADIRILLLQPLYIKLHGLRRNHIYVLFSTGQELDYYLLKETADAHGIKKTALVLVGDFISHGNYDKSRLYAPDFSTEYRKAKEQ